MSIGTGVFQQVANNKRTEAFLAQQADGMPTKRLP